MTTNTEKRIASGMKEYMDQFDDLPVDVLLGRLVVFTISDHGVPCQQLLDEIARLNLTAIPAPNANTYVDAFRKATSDVKDDYPMLKNRTGILMCRDVNTTSEYVRRQITREIKDSGKKRLSYDPAIECTFFKPTDASRQETARLKVVVQSNLLEAEEVEYLRLTADLIAANYQRYFERFDGQKIRAWLRGYLKKLNAVEIKGGNYFVPVSRDPELRRLATLVNGLGGRCEMNMIPMVNLENQRQFITRVFEREATESLREIAKDIETMFTARKGITMQAYAKMKARYDEVLGNASEHMDNLQITQDMTAASAQVTFDALKKLMDAALQED